MKDYLSFILAVTIGQFRSEEGSFQANVSSDKTLLFQFYRDKYEDDSNVTNSRAYRNDLLRNYRVSCQTFSNGHSTRTNYQVR